MNSMLDVSRAGRTLAVWFAATALALDGCGTTTGSLPQATRSHVAFERAAHVRSFAQIGAGLVPAVPIAPLHAFHAADLHSMSVHDVPGDQRDVGLRLHHEHHSAQAASATRHTATNMIAAESGGQSNQLVSVSGFDDVYANITLYRLSDFKLQSPYTDTNRLYAPTVKPGVGDSGRGCYTFSQSGPTRGPSRILRLETVTTTSLRARRTRPARSATTARRARRRVARTSEPAPGRTTRSTRAKREPDGRRARRHRGRAGRGSLDPADGRP